MIVRFRLAGATVAIAGEWDDWQPHALRRSGEDVWEGSPVLRPGRYRCLSRVDGTTWVVPEGIPVERDSAGGMVGVLTVR